ncbi:MAG: SMC family ATPase [Patescibacteria group bacterium]
MIEHLKARGLIGINRGTGLDEIELDFTGREGIVAFSGKNGAGKTSVIDLLHCYDILPSRFGLPGQPVSALKHHVYLKDSLIDLTFTHMGRRYRKEIKIDSQSGKSEGKVFIDGSEKSATTGAISEYKKWAVQTFGSEELFFASNFKAQGATDVSKMTAGKLKALFAEFLRLDRYEAWADTAKQAGNILGGKVGTLQQRIDILEETLCLSLDTTRDLNEESSKLDSFRDDKTLLQQELTKKRQAVDTLKEAINQNALALQRRADIQGQIDRLTAELAKEKAITTADIEKLEKQWTTLYMQIKGCDALLQHKEKIERAATTQRDLEKSLVILQAAIDDGAEKVPGYQERVTEIEKQIAALRQELKDLENNEELRTIDGQIATLNANIDKRSTELSTPSAPLAKAKADVENLRRAANVGDGIDGDCSSMTCAAIKSVNEAKKKLPAAEIALDGLVFYVTLRKTELSAEIETFISSRSELLATKGTLIEKNEQSSVEISEKIKTATHDLRNAQTILQGTNEILAADRAKLKTIKEEIAQQKTLADRLPEIQIAAARKADLEKQLAEVTEQGTAKKEAWGRKLTESTGEITVLTEKLNEIVTDFGAELRLGAINGEIKEIETIKIPAIEKEIQVAREKIATLQAELTKIEAAEKELETVRTEREALTAKIARWKYLQIGCGQNGLQALEIDGATPAINDRANKLLYEGYGPEFTIKVVTQDDRGKECLDILVISEHGEELLSLKSGGERTFLVQPIRLAMALLNREKSGRDFDMAFFDESDGQLDSEGTAQHYMELYRPFMEMGGIRQNIIITHKPECLAYCDHILKFEKGVHPYWA